MLSQEKYKKEVVAKMQDHFSYKNINMVPKIEKIVINCGIDSQKDRDVLQETLKTLAAVTGQKAVPCRARNSVAGFKLREGMNIGAKVTLRSNRMYDFIDRLINNALPRVRDFRGVKRTGFDGRGNFTMGIADQSIFTEIDLDKIKHTIGMDITFVTSANTDDEGRTLLEYIGMPFRK